MSLWTAGWMPALQVACTCTRKGWTSSAVSHGDLNFTCCIYSWSATVKILVVLESLSLAVFTCIVLELSEDISVVN